MYAIITEDKIDQGVHFTGPNSAIPGRRTRTLTILTDDEAAIAITDFVTVLMESNQKQKQ
jgi:hypothetical protein